MEMFNNRKLDDVVGRTAWQVSASADTTVLCLDPYSLRATPCGLLNRSYMSGKDIT